MRFKRVADTFKVGGTMMMDFPTALYLQIVLGLAMGLFEERS